MNIQRVPLSGERVTEKRGGNRCGRLRGVQADRLESRDFDDENSRPHTVLTAICRVWSVHVEKPLGCSAGPLAEVSGGLAASAHSTLVHGERHYLKEIGREPGYLEIHVKV